MPRKPKPPARSRVDRRRKANGRAAPDARDERLREAGDLVPTLGNPDMVAFSIEAELADLAARRPHVGRYTRVTAAIAARFGCDLSTAKRAMAGAKVVKLAQFLDDLPYMRAESSAQLQRIADTQEDTQPMAAVAALREKHCINGLHVSIVSVGGVTPEQQQAVAALSLTPYERQQRIAELRAGQADLALGSGLGPALGRAGTAAERDDC